MIVLGVPLTKAAPAYRIETVATGLARPWSLAFLPDGRALVTEGVGRLRVLVPDDQGRLSLQAEAVSGLPALYSEGQAGLFEVLPDPDFANNQLLYLSYASGTREANHLQVVRARLDGGRLQDVQTLFTSQPAKPFGQHFGARMALLGDGTLAITLGDGNVERTDAQRLDTHLGKIVRITRDGDVPADNPFADRPGALPEIYSLGHRNPQGLVWVAERQALYQHEHGSKGGDELNLIRAGANYGWPLTTGGVDYTGARITPFRELPGITPPLLEWTPSIAPAGLTWYDGTGFPAWRGSLFVAALREKSVRRIPLVDGKPGQQELLFQELDQRLRDVRSGPDGTLWLLTDGEEGQVLRVVPG
ncbi:PQQ-dependent sugar dehydrogenase [Pseudomonas rhizoryzae]|uniref:PQQ-dependent sugar dehydrogenase n=1 Tax=Pseudomonas rhizoryzae TaxID=2571129 RepID=UPI0007374D74|nr:PQQ-dependent sugar dehydrogenase [Pseudomonas rhizoryzae]KTT30181.1 glucose dehydrogenase [Pseudomonas psychrotolerans]KTT36520.1 glucose dehydrogenase [Pseudomonas psychrotolerans]KTT78354.1 glucose dehydrogenase [Pseudomonas psychrotolerans]